MRFEKKIEMLRCRQTSSCTAVGTRQTARISHVLVIREDGFDKDDHQRLSCRDSALGFESRTRYPPSTQTLWLKTTAIVQGCERVRNQLCCCRRLFPPTTLGGCDVHWWVGQADPHANMRGGDRNSFQVFFVFFSSLSLFFLVNSRVVIHSFRLTIITEKKCCIQADQVSPRKLLKGNTIISRAKDPKASCETGGQETRKTSWTAGGGRTGQRSNKERKLMLVARAAETRFTARKKTSS